MSTGGRLGHSDSGSDFPCLDPADEGASVDAQEEGCIGATYELLVWHSPYLVRCTRLCQRATPKTFY
jgi:hypothetical protein